MLTYPNIKYRPTTNFFWGVLPFRILVNLHRDPTKKQNFKEQNPKYIAHLKSLKSKTIRVAAAYSSELNLFSSRRTLDRKHFIYCATKGDVEHVMASLDPGLVKILAIAGPENQQAYDVMAKNPGCHVGDLFHGKYEWRLSLTWLRDHEHEKFKEWIKSTFGSLVTDSAFYDPKTRNSLFLESDDDVLVAKLTYGKVIKKTTRAIRLDKNNNKEGSYETRTIPQTHREELDCAIDANRS